MKTCSKDSISEDSIVSFESSRNERQEKKQVQKKPKKQYYIRANPLPKILKRDIRREYARMYANVMNSTDFNTIDSFFKYLCTPECQVMKYESLNPILSHQNETNVLHSIDSLRSFVCHTYLVGASFPDFTLNVQSPKISQREGVNGSKVIFNVSMSGTKVDPPTCSDCSSTEHPSICTFCEDPTICQWTTKYKSMPTNIRFEPQLVMHLDELHRIYQIDFIVAQYAC